MLLIAAQASIAVFSQTTSRDLTSAIRFSQAIAAGRFVELKIAAHSAKDPMDRLFAAYILYKIDPISNSYVFTRSFPKYQSGIARFIGLYQTIPYSEKEEGNEYRHPQTKWTIGFWSIYHAYLERVKAGNPIALERFLKLDGLGDGEVGEGIASDIGELFYRPRFVLSHWKILEPHQRFLRSIKNWVTPDQFLEIRSGYMKLLQPDDPRRSVILGLLNNPE